jgi:hypothetical protein
LLEVLSAQKRGGQSTLTVVDWGPANFVERRQSEVRGAVKRCIAPTR